jgi:hypothetical protein
MPKPKLYVPLSGSKLRVRETERNFTIEYADQRGVSISQAVRDMIRHCMECPFFNGSNPTSGNIPSSGK